MTLIWGAWFEIEVLIWVAEFEIEVLIWVVEFEIGGRFSGRRIVHVWSDRFTEKVRKRWT